jgi:hypothetical protein
MMPSSARRVVRASRRYGAGHWGARGRGVAFHAVRPRNAGERPARRTSRFGGNRGQGHRGALPPGFAGSPDERTGLMAEVLANLWELVLDESQGVRSDQYAPFEPSMAARSDGA